MTVPALALSRLRAFGLAGLAALAVSACAAPGNRQGGATRSGDGIAVSSELVEEPAAFAVEGLARRPPGDAAGGYWAVVPGLPRAESAVVRREGRRQTVNVALFRGTPPAGSQILLSEAAAAVLGIGDTPVQVRLTAVREELALVRNSTRNPRPD